ncbi:MAG: hypothetical protein MRY64_13025 [Hyphomonadaceae bacterium]|nr:hypothetical protein [Hyphomonadaceae bacterium]
MSVRPGAEAIIDPGAILAARTIDSLIHIPVGARLLAEGEVDNPIEFTALGQLPGFAPSETTTWAGIHIDGDAPISGGTDISYPGGTFGGTNADHDGGVLKYVQINSAGSVVGNTSLALNGVGARTELAFIEINRAGDDGLVIHGGTAQLSNIAIINPGDDGLDFTGGWKGQLDFLLVDGRQSAQFDNGIEGDGRLGGDSGAPSEPLISHFTLLGGENSDTGILLKTAAGGRYQNGVISGFNVGVDLDAPNGSGPLAPLAFRSNLFIGPGSLFANDGDEPATTTQSFIQDAAALTVYIAAPDGTELSSEGLPGLGFPSVTVTGNTTNFAGDIVDRVGAFASTETPWNTWLSSWSSSVLPAEPTGTELADVIIATWQDTTTDTSRGAPVTSTNGAGGDDTLYGSGRNDDLNGGAGNDVVFGAAGDDRLVTGLGIDVIDSGDGVDTLIFEAAFNEASIGFGEDSISGSLGSASFQNVEAFVVDGTAVTSVGGLQLNASAAPAGVNVYGSDRADMFIGSSFEDQFRDSGGADTYTGGDGADTFVFDLSEAGRGNGDTITDFQDDDRLIFISLGISGFDALIPTFIGSEAFFGVPGQFRVDRRGAQTVVQYDADGDGVSDNSIILDGNFILAADVEIIPLLGIDVDLFQVSMIVDRDNGETIGDDILTGTSAADVLFGGIGDDLIEGLSGPDTLDGGDGVDTLSFVSALSGITANLSSGIATDDGGDRDAISNFENLVGSMFDDVLRGDTGANRLVGGNGDDRLFAVGGNGNELIGGTGSDSLFGGDGADTLDGGTGDDLIQGLGGDDTIRVESGSNVIFAGEGNDQVFGGIGDDTIDGESGNDVIFGDFGDDSIRGGAGADELRGEAGNDTLYGEDGDDRISGGTGNDTIFGGGGADDLTGGSEDDAIFGGDGNDLIQGQGGNDDLSGGSGDDLIRGGLNDDLLDGGDGDDLLIGGGGVDRFIAGAGDDSVVIDNDDIRQDESGRPLDIGGSGYDTLILAPGSTFATSVLERYGFEAFVGAENDDRVRGRDDNVSYRLEGRGGDDELQGAGGDDTLVGGAGADTLTGGDGFDFASYEDATARVIVRLSTGRGKEDVAQSDLLFSIEGLVGGNFNDALFGSDVDNTLIGGLGDDFLDGLDGDDLLVGGAGADRLVGGNGVDTVSFEYASEQVAIDLLTGDGQLGDAEGDIYQEIENIIGGLGHDSLFGDFGDNQISGRGGDDFLKGLDGADILIGDDGSDILIGGAGMDSFDAGEGNDTVYLDGDDLRFRAGSTTDRDFGGAGYDTLILEAGTQFVTNGLGAFGFEAFRGAELNDRVRGNIASVDYDLDGGGGDDELTGNDGNDVLRGGLGVDIMLGLDGDDTIYFETGDVRMNSATGRALNMGGQGRDTLILEAGTRFVTNGLSLFGFEVFRGAELNDRVRGNFKSVEYDLDGGAGDDELTGNNQNDRLVGGVGNDILDGGAGDDTFVFDASHTGHDAVLRLQDRDTVLLTGFGYGDAMDAAGDFTQAGADVVFSNGGVTVTFQNKALSSVLATVEVDLTVSPSTDAAPAQMGAAVKEPVPVAVTGEIHAESFDFTGLNAPEEPAELALELALVANLDIEIGIIDAHHGFDIRFDGLELSTPWHGSDDLETIEGWG